MPNPHELSSTSVTGNLEAAAAAGSFIPSGVPPIPKLEGQTNYASWSFGMKMFLIDCGLWNCVDAPEELAKQRADFNRLDEQARAKICLSVSPRIYSIVKSGRTAQETWKKLQIQYADKGLDRRLSLLKQLFNSKLTGDMETYINNIRDVQEKLNEINAELEDEFIGVIMLAGLPEEYKPLIMALEHSGARITSDAVATMLLKEDRKQVNPTVSEPSTSALTTKSTSKVQCKFCKKFGHIITNCRKRKNYNKKHVIQNTNITTDMTLSSSYSFHLHPSNSGSNKDSWLLDSGATSHMCNNKSYFQNMLPMSKPIYVANNDAIQCEGKGTVSLSLSNDVSTISNVLYVPSLASNLLSVSSLVSDGFITVFSQRGATILRHEDCNISGHVVATASNFNHLYKLDFSCQTNLSNSNKPTALLWHRRLAHLNSKSLNILKKKNVGIEFTDSLCDTCIPCLQGKLARKPFLNSKSKSSALLQLVHSDLCGPMSTHSWGGALYLLTFTDDFSRKTFGYLLKSKTEVFDKFVEFKRLVENQTGHRIKVLRSDNGTEYVNNKMSTFLKENGIIHQTTVPYTPQQNGVSERANRTIIEKARAMLEDAKLPRAYWGEAVNTAIYLKNHSPTQSLKNKIPEELWTGKRVSLSHLRVFGCLAHILIPKEKRTKLDSKTKECIFVGYSTETKGYRVIDPKNPKQIVLSRDVVFIENEFYEHPVISDQLSCNPPPSLMQSPQTFVPVYYPIVQPQQQPVAEPEKVILEDSSTSSQPADDTQIQSQSPEIDSELERSEPSESRYPSRERRLPLRYRDDLHLTTDFEPETYKEAVEHLQKDKWLDAMNDEYNSLLKNHTWKLVDRPKDRKTIKCKWVYKIKKDANGDIVKYKARLVAKGFTQVAGIDYGETFSPVARLSTVRLLLAFAVQYKLIVDHLDVETAFLHGDLEEEIYMEQPDGFSTDSKNKVCLLKKSLYGLKQAPRQWNLKVCEAMHKLSLTQTANEHCLYYRRNENDFLIVAVFVDDFFILCTNEEMKTHFKDQLKLLFSIKDLGPVTNCLGMRVTQNDGTITLDQTQYIEKLLQKFNMTDALTVNTPLETGLKLTKPEPGTVNEEVPYQELIGSLMYIAIGTRPDIAHTVSYLSQFNAHYGGVHWKAAKRVLRYLKGTKDLRLHYKKSGQLYPTGYVDADYGNNLIDRRSYTGYVFMMSGAPISWEARKQRTVALSTTEAEYMALTEACKEAIYLKSLISDVFAVTHTIIIHTDNQSSLKLAHNNTYHARTKHIDIKHHFIRETLSQHNLQLKYISTQEMLADIFTKPLMKLKHKKCMTSMGLT